MATSSEAFKAFKSAGVVVFAHSKKEYGALPAGAKEVRPKGGNTIPMVLVTTANGAKGIDAIPYATLKSDLRKSVRNLKEALESVDVLGGDAGDDSGDSSAPGDDSEPEFAAWENAQGKQITAAVQEVKDGKVHFLLSNGKSVWYPIDKLSAESQERLKKSE